MIQEVRINGQKTEQLTMRSDARDERGRFVVGNPGGPGRRRLTVEREYLAALGQAVSLEDWREVVARALADAKNGDNKARNWLAKYLIGSNPRTLLAIAAVESLGFTPDDDIRIEASGPEEGDDDWSDMEQLTIEDSDLDDLDMHDEEEGGEFASG